MMGAVHLLPGTTFSDVKQKGAYRQKHVQFSHSLSWSVGSRCKSPASTNCPCVTLGATPLASGRSLQAPLRLTFTKFTSRVYGKDRQSEVLLKAALASWRLGALIFQISRHDMKFELLSTIVLRKK